MCVWCSFSVSVLVGVCSVVESNGGQEVKFRAGDGNEPSGPPFVSQGRIGTKIRRKKENKRCGNRIAYPCFLNHHPTALRTA